MNKIIQLSTVFLVIVSLAACGTKQEETTRETFTYESEAGDVEVFENPERIVVLSTFLTGHALFAEGNIVGATSWDFLNENYTPHLENAEVVSADDVEGILALEPDLILADPSIANKDQIKAIAPTVLFTYGNLTYLEQYVEIATLLDTRSEAEAWVEDFQYRAKTTGEDIKALYGESVTVSVIESYGKELYVYGDNWGRGTEILYQEMELNMPKAVRDDALEPGYYAISTEVLPDYMGDFVILSKHVDADTSFETTSLYQNTDAFQNDRIIIVDGTAFSYNDPMTLEWQLDTFIDFFLAE
ncbi:MAG: ABC transporter substrate-binding protein [Bacillota bacterium]